MEMKKLNFGFMKVGFIQFSKGFQNQLAGSAVGQVVVNY